MRFEEYTLYFIQSNKMQEPSGLTIEKEYISHKVEEKLIIRINSEKWDESLVRRTQHYGYRYDYKSKDIRPANQPIPKWISKLFPGKEYDQCIINRYLPGEGISAHTDRDIFGDEICSLSLGSPVTMMFTRQHFGHQFHDVWLQPRSLLTMTGEARNLWKHEIPARKVDFIPEGKRHIKRTTRYSITMRTMIDLD